MKTMLVFLTLLGSTFLLAQDKPAPANTEAMKAAPAKAEPIKNPVVTAVKEIFARQQKNLTAAVEEMPADKFGFKPTPEQMPFGHLVAHMTMANIELCGKAANMPSPPMRPGPETDKERLVAGLTRSFAFCDAALNHVDDSRLGDSIELFGGKQTSVAFALIALTDDWADHYSAAATYLRLNGLLPPTAQPK
jgi:DinB family protein